MINKGKKLLNPLVAAQNFEYKMSNILGTELLVLYSLLILMNCLRQTSGE